MDIRQLLNRQIALRAETPPPIPTRLLPYSSIKLTPRGKKAALLAVEAIRTPTKAKRGPYKQKKVTKRDDRRDIKMAFRCSKSIPEIASMLEFTEDQVKYALEHPDTPSKRPGRRPKIDDEGRAMLIEHVCESRKNRRKTALELALFYNRYARLNDLEEVGEEAIVGALKREGFNRRSAMRKPKISDQNQKKRLAFAIEHKDWTVAQWCRIFWSDETWVTWGRHRKTRIWRRPGEEWEPDCVEELIRKKKGWMFWGSFLGNIRGPALFWQKDWGTINQYTYRQYTVPQVYEYLKDINGLRGGRYEKVFMQDGAPGHAAKDTKALLEDIGVVTMVWPPYSPDMNPIETVWKYMKNYLENKYGDSSFGTYEE